MSKSQIKKKWQEQWKRSDEGEREHCDNDETLKYEKIKLLNTRDDQGYD